MIPSHPLLAQSGSVVQETSEWKNLLSKQRLATVSTKRPERLSSAIHIVFEQMALICHLVEGTFVAWEWGNTVHISIGSLLRELLVDRDK